MDCFEMLRRALEERCPALELREQEGMTRHTTFRLGGPVRLMALPKTREEAICAVRTAWEMDMEPFILGNGSNLLVPDEGVERFVVKLMDGLTGCRVGGETIYAESGLLLARLANAALEHGLTGLEFAPGNPGTLGGAQVAEMHAGCVGNRGGATCGDVLRLVDGVRERVLKETGVELEMEVKLLK